MLREFNRNSYADRRNLDYRGAINRVLLYQGIKDHFGIKANYDSHVNCWPIYREKKDLKELIKYVLGEKAIVDKEGIPRTINKGEVEELVLLHRGNIVYKNGKTGKYNNPKIFKIMQRADGAHAYNDDFLNYGEILDNIFGSNSALNFFGKTPSYDEHVRYVKLM